MTTAQRAELGQSDSALRMIRKTKAPCADFRIAPVLLFSKLPGWIESEALRKLDLLQGDVSLWRKRELSDVQV